MHNDIIIASYARTPMGSFQGAFSGVPATQLGIVAVKAAVARAGVDPALIQRIYMGNVLSHGLGQAPARQVAIGAGLPVSVEATTLNKMCGSGMQAAIMAAEALKAGAIDVAVAGGMESMTNAPYMLPKHRAGARMGNDTIIDSLMGDGLEDAYEHRPMGAFAEDTAREYQFSREAMDNFAIRSLSRASAAIASGAFAGEIAPVTVTSRAGETVIDTDEQPSKSNPARIPSLKAAFAKDGGITAASSASISDGAAALVVTRADVAERMGMSQEAKLVAYASHAHDPARFTTAPVFAIRKLLDTAGWSIDEVDLFEVNEAFSAVAMIAVRDLGIAEDKINVNGGATALGHPIGASGARIIATLIAALKARGLKRGVAALCIAGGEATAVAIEVL